MKKLNIKSFLKFLFNPKKIENPKGEEMSEELTSNGKVICLICKREFIMITAAHLKKEHSTTTEGYKMRFPGADMAGEIFKAKQRGKSKKKKIFEEKDNNEDIPSNEDIRDLAQKIINEDISISETLHEPKTENQYVGFRNGEDDNIDYNSDNSILENDPIIEEDINYIKETNFPEQTVDKNVIISFLISNGFENIKDNYLISKKSLSGLLEYEFISDICDILKKVDFQFKKVFWHNQDKFLNNRRNLLLKQDGWKIIEVDSNPIILSEILEKINK